MKKSNSSIASKDPFAYFDSAEFLRLYEEEADKQGSVFFTYKINPIERGMMTMQLQQLHYQGRHEEMSKLIEETVKKYRYSIDFEVAPTPDIVSLILDEAKKLNQTGIVSIGCSNGLFEYFLQTESKKKKYEIEIYAVDLPKGMKFFQMAGPAENRSPAYYDYMKIIEIDYKDTYPIKSDQALFMCFSHPADKIWQRYLKAYKGNCIIIIGKKYYTLPYPEVFIDFPNQTQDKWELIASKEVGSRNPGTSLAIYKKI